jgi:acyl carrier protein
MNKHFLRTTDATKTNAIEYIRESIRTYIKNNFILGTEETLNNDTSLLDAGIIDSTSALELVEFLETAFKIKIDDRDLNPEHFDTIDCISRFVASKIAQQSAV